MTTSWSFPTRIVYGIGAISELGKAAKALGDAALIVTDPGVIKAGVIDKVRASLDAAQVKHATFDGVHGNPLEKDVHDGLAAYRAANAKLVIAVGGGRSIGAPWLAWVWHPLPMGLAL